MSPQVISSSIPSNEHTFSMTLAPNLARRLAPSARVVTWYITENGEIISDSLDFNVDGAFANDVCLHGTVNNYY